MKFNNNMLCLCYFNQKKGWGFYMEKEFLTVYFDFLKNIKQWDKKNNKLTDLDANNIVAIINTDYGNKTFNSFLDKHSAYRQSVNNLFRHLQTPENLTGLSASNKKQINKLISDVNRKSSSLDKSITRLREISEHYSAIKSDDISFVVIFRSGEYWNINFTTSIRNDRIDTHANRFKQANATKNYLVTCSYPYQDDASIRFINEVKENPNLYGCSINIVCLEELMDDIMDCIFKYKKNRSGKVELVKPKDRLSIVNGQRGRQVEYMYTEILKNTINFDLFQKGIKESEREITVGSFLPNHYDYIIRELLGDSSISKHDIQEVTAERTGGAGHKADIQVSIKLNDGTILKKGISIKSSSVDEISVNEKHAEDFIDALRITDSNVKTALRQFEEKQTLEKMDPKLKKALSDYFEDDANKKALVTWSISGKADDPLKADYVMLHSYTYNSKEANKSGLGIKIMSSQEYIDDILTNDLYKTFGTHLTWTYKNNIQLKAPFLFDP